MNGIIFFIFYVIIAILLAFVPISIAESRGIKGQSLTIIKVLSWLGLLLGITWFVALIMSLVCEANSNHSSISNLTDLEMLEKLAKLKDIGAITDAEFNQKKQEILGIKDEIKGLKPFENNTSNLIENNALQTTPEKAEQSFLSKLVENLRE